MCSNMGEKNQKGSDRFSSSSTPKGTLQGAFFVAQNKVVEKFQLN